jgi:hypothetical protein
MNRDLADTIRTDPRVAAEIPDAAARDALVAKKGQLDTEYALAKDPTASRVNLNRLDSDSPNLVTGGDYPSLDFMKNPANSALVAQRGSSPENMSVLQRNLPQMSSREPGLTYPAIASEVMRRMGQMKTPVGEMNVSPEGFHRAWSPLDPATKDLYTNGRPVPGQPFDVRTVTPEMAASAPPYAQSPAGVDADRLARVGDYFSQAASQSNTSRTAPSIAMMRMLTGAVRHPVKTGMELASGHMSARATSSEELARIIAGMYKNDNMTPLLTGAARAGISQANQAAQNAGDGGY